MSWAGRTRAAFHGCIKYLLKYEGGEAINWDPRTMNLTT
jgi:hypothetical protein